MTHKMPYYVTLPHRPGHGRYSSLPPQKPLAQTQESVLVKWLRQHVGDLVLGRHVVDGDELLPNMISEVMVHQVDMFGSGTHLRCFC